MLSKDQLVSQERRPDPSPGLTPPLAALAEKPPRSDVLPAMAQAFGVRLEELLKVEAEKRTAARKKNGPTGRVREVFDRVSKLPRRQQEKIVEFVSAFVTQYEQNKHG